MQSKIQTYQEHVSQLISELTQISLVVFPDWKMAGN